LGDAFFPNTSLAPGRRPSVADRIRPCARVRLINLALLTSDDAFFAEEDTLDYWKLSAKLTSSDGFWPALLSITDRMPLYPLAVAGVRSAFGDAPRIVALAQAVIDAGTCTLIAALGALISPLAGLVAGILAALSATLIVLSTQLLTDTLFLFFFTLMLLAAARFALCPTLGLQFSRGSPAGSRSPRGPRSACCWRRRCRSFS
jgi:hypothetical protein